MTEQMQGRDKIELIQVEKRFGDHVLYEAFSLTIQKGIVTAFTGASGCGKTTLLRMIAGLEPVTGGRIEGIRGENVTVLFQEDRLLPWLTVGRNVELALFGRKERLSKKAAKKRALETLSWAGLTDQFDAFPAALSGGMRRRASLARALACQSSVLLMDEPFTGIDRELRYRLAGDLRNLFRERNKTVLLVTHDWEDVSLLADEVYELSGKPVSAGRRNAVAERENAAIHSPNSKIDQPNEYR